MQYEKLNDLSLPPEDVDLEKLHLGGVSGGGIWVEVASPSTGAIWRPDPRLIALEVSFKPRDKWSRGTLLRPWLNLVRAHYSDLEDLIQYVLAPK